METQEQVIINGYEHIRYHQNSCTGQEMIQKSGAFYELMDARRSVREFSDKPVSKTIIQNIIKTASTAPSGAHKQPWTFCAISNDQLKSKIRIAAEKEEVETYSNRMSDRWRKDLAPLGTDTNKPFIEEAPWIIVVFKRVYEYENEIKHNNYYVNESIGIASGMLITAIHQAGLVTLTHTPSPMNFLTKVLDRPSNERAYLLLPVGYPKDPVYVPNIERKKLDEVSVFYE
ncbi:nitroreductase family protein [Aquimarina sp. 2201CG5-10]|uniref:nitroreductase family protein n=1 Tax=Aquimarina callyspongiae TaxID=3098150 RepID=UPI002AB51AF7|nr:nitroreductase family protein [Aquimarina sp. 2201CG5-10]MDY8134211.1 nitroreductase family protein [Aquimarina sp. 2201CG5-10]